ncbi:Putative DNA-binding domain-containing protein [Thalassobacillus cyri]|uniref:Putative DNA-binding domain-containing protein n=1 Tax=Thalassobacillus cyri TaxID=571932 RepID=A0A1H4G9A8_9BACI|nr:ATP-binding protein [Thalassobacillus cyri]SEB05871.1 Putative DNA-binding domain-containing protein [Thalassobacillus cyri]
MYDKILELLDAEGETRNIEFKKTYDWNNPQHKVKIVKCILAMSNTKDGGYLLLGIDEEKYGEEKLTGMELEHFGILNYDHIIVEVNKFADPPISFHMYPVQEDGKYFVLLRIPEFDELPIVCKRSGEQGLKEGAVFSRSKIKPESAQIRSQSEMRELIDIAINKGVKEFYKRVRDSGLQVTNSDSSDEKYAREIQMIKDIDVLTTIRETGYWRITIRPSYYLENRIDSLTNCRKVIMENQLSLRGWNFPHFRSIENGNNFIQASENWGEHKELLRLYKSGNFVYFKAMREDYIDKQHLRNVKGRGLAIINTLFLFTEIFEFASRLSQTNILGDEITVSIECFGIKDRELFFFEPMRTLFSDYVSTIEDSAECIVSAGIEELIADSDKIAIETLLQLFENFNWDASGSIGIFREEQQKLLSGTY